MLFKQITFAAIGLFLTIACQAQVNLNHTWQPHLSTTNPYGLTDLDHFSPGDYAYCRWGNLMDHNTRGILSFTTLTKPWLDTSNTDLFVNGGLASLQVLSHPPQWSWFAPGKVDVTSPTMLPLTHDYALMRYLHFKNQLLDETTRSPLNSSAKKIVVVIHGWNRTSGDPFAGEFQALKNSLYPRLANKTGWSLVFYEWSADADTGNASLDATLAPDAVNPTKAAEIAHLHGQHLGELLAKSANFQNVHFIAHSAGTWAARSAARYLMENTGAKVQITLLDPFIPGMMRTLRITPNQTSLTKDVIDSIPSMDPSNSGQLYFLENYYALDQLAQFTANSDGWSLGSDTVYRATSQEFSWGSKGFNQRVDWPVEQNASIAPHYKWHSGPVQFYADTATYSTGSGVGVALNNPDFDLTTIGWRRSMFYQEPSISPLAALPKVYRAGENTSIYAAAKIRGDIGPALSDASYQWQKLPPGLPDVNQNWQMVATGTAPASSAPAYAIPGLAISVAADMNGTLYRLVVTNNAGTDVSNSIRLDVGASNVPIPAAPSGLVAYAVNSTQVNLAWTNNASNATSVIIERKIGASGTFAPITTSPPVLAPTIRTYSDTGLTPGTLYYYRVVAAGSPSDSLPSVAANAMTLPGVSTTRLLTVNSSSPGSGVRIILGPNDIYGAADANASFTRQYASNTEVTLVAPTSWGGAAFLEWQADGKKWGTSTITSVVMDSNHTLTAVYSPPTQGGANYNIVATAEPSNGGSVSGGGSYTANASVSLQASPASGYQFLNWTVNTTAQNGGAVYSADPNLSFAAIAPLSLVANFTQNGVGPSITTTAAPTNGGTVSGGGTYQSGQIAPVTATPASGWEFGTWTDEYGAIVSFSSSFSYPVYQSRTYVAHFNPILSQNYTLSMTAVNGTAIRSPNQTAYTPNSQVTVTATPASGYLFTGWSGDASGSQNPLTVTMTGNKAVTANFSAVPASTYTLTLPARTGGSVTKSPDLPNYPQGTVVTLTAAPSAGYVFGSWRRDSYGSGNPLQITMDGNKTAVADFIPSSPGSSVLVIGTPTNLSLPAAAGSGTLSVINQGSGTMYWSASPTVNWLQVNSTGSSGVTGGGGSNGLSYSWIENPTTNARSGEIRVYSPGAQQNPQIFTITQAAGTPAYAIQVTADNGSVSRSLDQASYTPGTQVTLTAAPITGYQFTGWSGDAAGNQPSIIVTVDGNKNIVANFQIVPVPDLFPAVSASTAIAYSGTSYPLAATIGNRGFSSSNAFKVYAVFSNSNLTAPSADLISTTTPLSHAGLAAGSDTPFSTAVNVPNSSGPSTLYLWIIVDPETTSGESANNRSNNILVMPFTVLPTPAADGPDLVLKEFSVSSSTATAGGSINVSGKISNYGTAPTAACQYYVSISASASIQPDKNTLNAAGSLTGLGIGLDGDVAQMISLPGVLAAGDYYLWVIADPEYAAGEPMGNWSNNTVVLPLTLLQPPQTYTVAASSASAITGSVSGGGTYASGAVVPLVALPAPGYAFVNWTEGGTPVSTAPSYVFPAAGNRTLVANFVLQTWAVTPSSGANGILSPGSVQTVIDGSGGGTFTATPNAGHRVNTWSINGNVVQVGGTTFTLGAVTANTTVSVSFKSASLGAPGNLDPSFGTGGKVITSVGSSDDLGQAVAVQADGKIVVAGCVRMGSNFDTVAVVRYLPDGSLDTSFNSTGIASFPTGFNGSFNASLAIQADGKILVHGFFTLARLNTDGSLDTTFNSTGKASTSPYFGSSTLVQDDGKIVVAGYATVSGNNHFALIRYNASGTLDSGFNGTGRVTTLVGSGADIAQKVVQQNDGKLVVTGYTTIAAPSDRAVATVRYNTNGSLDTTFNGTGIVTTDFGTSDDEGKSVAVQSDGKIVVAGFGGSTRHALLLRYNTDGSPDPTFNGTGQLVTTGNSSTAYGLSLQEDGKILVAGGSANYFLVLRCNPNGTLDSSFNDTGMVTSDIGPGNDIATNLAVQSDGRVVLVGQASNGTNNDIGVARYLAVADADIVVEKAAGGIVLSGGEVSFGHLNVGTSSNITFTVRNMGGTALSGLAITQDGADTGMYTLTASPASQVTPYSSTTFAIQFSPASAGAKNAALHVSSNVLAKSPYNLMLSGWGNTPAESWRQQHFGTVANSGDSADTATPQKDGVPNLLKFATGLDPTRPGKVHASLVTGENNMAFTYNRSKTASTSGVTYVVEWSDSLVASTWNSAGVIEGSVVDQGSTEQVTVTVPAGTGGRRFVRLKVLPAP